MARPKVLAKMMRRQEGPGNEKLIGGPSQETVEATRRARRAGDGHQGDARRLSRARPAMRGETSRLEIPVQRFQAPAANREPHLDRHRAPRDLRLPEAVADAVERLDHVEVLVGLLELLAQPLDVAVDGAIVDVNLVVVGRIHQRIGGLHHAGSRGQSLQDEELGHRQHDRMVVPMAGVALRSSFSAPLQHAPPRRLRRGPWAGSAAAPP